MFLNFSIKFHIEVSLGNLGAFLFSAHFWHIFLILFDFCQIFASIQALPQLTGFGVALLSYQCWHISVAMYY